MNGLMQILADGWMLVIAAFFLGLLTGALVSRNKAAGQSAAGRPVDQINAVKDAISDAKKRLEEKEALVSETQETLAVLDNAVKRANGRLKLVLKSIKKAKNDR